MEEMMDSKLIVIAIGGNSLIEDSKHVTVKSQYEAARKTAEHIAKLVQDGHKVVIAHGNGPQVGFILLRAEHSTDILHTVPLDSCVADTQGAIGYQLQMALDNEFEKVGLKNKVATIVTQVEVSNDDPSFNSPSKPIGSFMSEEVAKERMEKNGWICKEDAGRGWRRVVPSPKPKSIVEIDTVKILGDNGITVIAAGGGGIPVVRNEDGTLVGKEAVIDKDLAAALMAKQLGADLFVISTAVEKVCLNYGKPNQKTLDTITTKEAKEYIDEGHFAPGSMLPKVQAIVDFVESTGNMGLITDPANLYNALHGDEGTKVVK
jgi:carbamate kinase